MSLTSSRAIRVLLPNDARLVWRDSFLLFVIAVLPLSGLLLRWLLPMAREWLSPWLDLAPYTGLLLGFFLLGQQPILLGIVAGILFVDERDEGTLLALDATPVSLSGFLAYRLTAVTLMSVPLSILGLALAGSSAGLAATLAAALCASLTAPLVGLVYAIWIQNKVQGVAVMKLVQSWAMVPALLALAPPALALPLSVAAPLYYPIRFFWSASAGSPEWAWLVPGTAIQLAALAWMLRRVRRVVLS